jgi:hypothetical protein
MTRKPSDFEHFTATIGFEAKTWLVAPFGPERADTFRRDLVERPPLSQVN